MPQMNMVQAINLALQEEMGRDGRVVILGEDVGRDGGVFRVTEGLIEAFGPERVIDTPLSESAIVGATVGMAAYGLRPVAEIQFMGFIYSAMDQLFAHAARIRTRSRGRFTAPLVVRTPYGAGIKAPELHEESSEAFFCHMPGIKVVVPSGPANAKGLLTAAIRDPDPVLFLEPTRLYRMVKEDVPEGEYALPLGKARIALPGSAVTVVAWGSMLQRAMKAVEGYDAEVIDPMTLSPFDWETPLASVKKTGRLVIVHEAPLTGGFGAEIAATVTEEAILHLRGPVIRVAGPDVPVPLRGVRHAVARNVMASQRNTAFVTGMEEADITELWELRRRELGAVEARGAHLTFLPFFIKVVQHALREHPYLNAAIDDAAEAISSSATTISASPWNPPMASWCRSSGTWTGRALSNWRRRSRNWGKRPEPGPSPRGTQGEHLHPYQLRPLRRDIRHPHHQLARRGHPRLRPHQPAPLDPQGADCNPPHPPPFPHLRPPGH